MSVKIRLARHGSKKRPYYRIVVADNDFKRDGRFLEIVGTYNPLPDPMGISLKKDRVKYWIDQGATPSDTVTSILKREGFYSNPV